jgi:hypothetical protein
MPTTIGALTNVPVPNDPITSPWAQDITRLGVHTFASKAALDTWAAPDGAHAWTIAEARPWVRIGGVWYRSPDWGTYSATSDANGRLVGIPHAVGRTPTALVVTMRTTNVQSQVEGKTATTFQVRTFTAAGANPGAFASVLDWIAWP